MHQATVQDWYRSRLILKCSFSQNKDCFWKHISLTLRVRLPDTANIFRAELYALLLAIDVVRRSKEKNFVIFSDSMSSLQSINGFNLDSDLVQKFLKDYTILAKNGKNVILCWSCGILGNEKADAAAKSALSLPVTCHSYEASCHWHVPSYNEADIWRVAGSMELLRWKQITSY